MALASPKLTLVINLLGSICMTDLHKMKKSSRKKVYRTCAESERQGRNKYAKIILTSWTCEFEFDRRETYLC